MTTVEAHPELYEQLSTLSALEKLAVKHRREFMRLRTLELAKLTGQPVRFRRERYTQEQLAALPEVTDVNGVVLLVGQRVRCQDGDRGVVKRVDRRSRRVELELGDGKLVMRSARRVTVTGNRRKSAAA